MKKTGRQRTAGFTLVEIIVAIAVMGLVSAPLCASLVLAGRLNAHSRAVMEAQLDVRTAVETLMRDGVSSKLPTFPGVNITREKSTEGPYYTVTVTSKAKNSGSDPFAPQGGAFGDQRAGRCRVRPCERKHVKQTSQRYADITAL